MDKKDGEEDGGEGKELNGHTFAGSRPRNSDFFRLTILILGVRYGRK